MKKTYLKLPKKLIVFKAVMAVVAFAATIFILSLRVNENTMWPSQIIAIMIYSCICLGILMFCMVSDTRLKIHDFDTYGAWIMFVCVYAAALLLTLFYVKIPLDYVPISLIPMVFSMCYEMRYGFISTIMFSSIFILVSDGNVETFLLIVLIGAVGSITARFYTKIKTIVVGFAIMILAAFFINLLFHYMLYEEIDIMNALFASIGSAISAGIMVVVALLYRPNKKILVWNTLKNDKLKNLTAPDSQPYRYLKSASIPVFTHSTEVMELALIGAKSITADEMLVKAGALYHDIGKCESSDYIKVGVNIAKKFKMPDEVIKIIKEHNVSTKLPTTKEAAIVMMADSVCTSYDYLKQKNPGKKIEFPSIIESVLQNRMNKGCLNESGITVEEFVKVKQAFIDWTSFMKRKA